jgi:hypothetical protein
MKTKMFVFTIFLLTGTMFVQADDEVWTPEKMMLERSVGGTVIGKP